MHDHQALVIFEPSGRQGFVPTGITLMEAAVLLEAGIANFCGATHTCGKCIVRIEDGLLAESGRVSAMRHTSPWQNETEGRFISPQARAEGCRLACVATVQGDLKIHIPAASRDTREVISKGARDIAIDWDPAVKLYYIQPLPPTRENVQGDFERTCEALTRQYDLPNNLGTDIHTLRRLPGILRQADEGVTVSVWQAQEIIRVQPGRIPSAYGLALDLGTTTLAGYLCDLHSMEVVAAAGMINPQCHYGADVMARILYATSRSDASEQLRDEIVAAINSLIARLLVKARLHIRQTGGDLMPANLQAEDIEDVCICANTVMHHLLLGLDPQFLGRSPFSPVVQRSLNLRARDMGIKAHPTARVFMLPNPAGFVGSDHVALLIGEEPYKHSEVQLILDIGTNGELALSNRQRLLCASCATGPALEGAQVTFGMRAAPGAIAQVEIEADSFEVDYKVIGRETWRRFSAPEAMQVRGICGSGILETLAALHASGAITSSGAFNRERLRGHPRFRRNVASGQNEFILAFQEESALDVNIVITQQDIRQIQLAKAALYAGCKLLLRRMGLKKPDRIKLAGAFGTHIDPRKALAIGLFPNCEIDRIECVGNAAGDGCRAALLNLQKRREADWVARTVEHVELAAEPSFEAEFMEAMKLPLTVKR